MLHKDHDPKGSVEEEIKFSGSESEGAWRQALIGCKSPVVK
jgi:hypothetical protein